MKPLVLTKHGDYWIAQEMILDLMRILNLPMDYHDGGYAVRIPDNRRKECARKMILHGLKPTFAT